MMEHKNSSNFSSEYKEIICSIQCNTLLLQEKSSILDKFFEFCSTRVVIPIFNFDKKQLHLFGSIASSREVEKQFLALQIDLFPESIQKQKTEGVYWWYEGWDATWQLYSPRETMELEYYFKSKLLNFTLINNLGEKITIDINKSEEIYGRRVKRIRRLQIDEQQPIYWTLTPSFLEIFLLNVNSNEYLSIKDNFDKTMKGHYTMFISIERIQNLRLFKQFCASHEDFIDRYGKENNGTMRFLYHGCPESASKKIIEKGFNRSYCGVNGCLYGRGVYFSSNSSCSNKFATLNERKEKRMFYSRVLIGRSMIGHSKICVPEKGYDTTTDGNHIFVCYHDSQCYPEYLLTYVQ